MESIDLPNIQPIGPIERSPEQELFSLQAQLQNLQKQLEIDRSYNNDQAVIDTSAKIAAIQRRMAEIVNVNQKSFKDFQPEGMLKGTIFDYIPDMFQVDAFMKDRFGEKGRTISNFDREKTAQILKDSKKGRTLPNQDREMMQGMKPNMSNGDEVNVDKLPEGLKAMYESGPKGKEGVENIAAKTDKFAEGDEVSVMMMEMEGETPKMMPSEDEIAEGLMELEGMQPEVDILDQFVGQVIQMIQAGASEQEVIQMLIQAGLDEEDINAIFQSVLEILESPNIDQQLQMLG